MRRGKSVHNWPADVTSRAPKAGWTTETASGATGSAAKA
jgi:hypothetical protein